MVFRVLGAISLGIGGIFGLVALLVLLPFIDNFNTSLLVLCGVFAVLAYVFLAIGWQLFHPPSGARGEVSRVVVDSDEAATAPEASAEPSAAVVAEEQTEEEAGLAAAAAAKDADPASAAEESASRPHTVSPNGSSADEAHVSTHSGFKKPGAPVPHK
jgi:hypothetical protein